MEAGVLIVLVGYLLMLKMLRKASVPLIGLEPLGKQ